MRTKTPIY